jgi:glycerol-3-phosphate dehydrogenase (NAD(P)+)
LAEAQEATHGQVAEGVKSCRSVLDLAQRHAVETPITQAVEAVCFRGLKPGVMLDLLMSRSVTSEARGRPGDGQ